MAKLRSHLSDALDASDLFDRQTDFVDPVLPDAGSIPAQGQPNPAAGFSSLASAADSFPLLRGELGSPVGGGGEGSVPTIPSLAHDSASNSSTSESSVVVTLDINGMSVAATPPPGAAAEVAFISGVTSSNQVAATSLDLER